MEKNTVVCLGELLIDFVPQSNGLPLSQVDTFHRAAGGAPANVAAAVAKLGGKSRFIGKVGRDPFGEFLRTALEEAGVEPALTITDDARTGLAFVSLREDGERDFVFFRSPAADMLLRKEDVEDKWLRDAAIFHFGSVSLIAEPCRTATLDAARRARAYGALVSYDPNVRLPLWTNADFARRTILDQLPFADLVKVSEDEIGFLYGGAGIEEGARLMLGLGPRCVVVTLGAAGCRVFTQTGDVTVPGVSVEAVDTTGAGDGFVGGLLWKLANAHIDASGLDETLAEPAFAVEALRFANAVGALATTKRGAIPALPARSEVERKLSGEA
ncbi:carbohydrate kinase [Paenibacillus hemerocallicola]|uniref:Carbohydrate kinase n=1 Tax=Paenibacillus hemerocallicola TaxID=1172614 RepID=A0A5C4T2Y7_9BACL|nr:PfkB family carbohydrate kinase [Paenibacillus hemerocallicola]TNJ63422.1 carbohydrate kinase [Paenibacillus hemerocallicola]